MNIDGIFDMTLFRQMQEEKMLTIRHHEGADYPLAIANYSDGAQYSNCWNDVTLNCRGLIYERHTGNVIARPWKKFFNLGDAKAPYIGFDDLGEVTDKLDGSLGIMYVYRDWASIATRGSFHSTQAAWATKHIRTYHRLQLGEARRYTFLFEIIYPKNRIVVDYGNFEGLILLGAVENSTGYVFGPYEACAMLNWPGLVTDVMPYRSINDVLAADDRENTEGYVIRAGNRMVKWKRPDYVELHRLISNLSEKSVWSGLEGGKTPAELCEALPDEFHGFVKETSANLLGQFDSRKYELTEKFSEYAFAGDAFHPSIEKESRKNFAFRVRMDPDRAFMFALLDSKDITPMIWQELKPKGETVAETV